MIKLDAVVDGMKSKEPALCEFCTGIVRNMICSGALVLVLRLC